MPIELSTLLKTVRRTSAPPQVADVSILVYEENLLHLGSGRHCLLSEQDDTQHDLDPQRLAEAARSLLPDTSLAHNLALFLPAHEFAATRVNMPGVTADKLHNAVRLQQPMLLPGLNVPLLLAVGAQQTSQGEYLALWFPVARAEALYQSFFAQGLFLNAILPRPLAAFSVDANQAVQDVDRCTRVFAAGQGNHLQQWLYITAEDYAQEVFRQQYDTQVQAHAEVLELSTSDAWAKLVTPSAQIFKYALRPHGAAHEQQRRQKARRWQQIRRVAAIAAVLLLACGIGLWLFKYNLERKLEALKDQTMDVSRLRAEILQIDEVIGPVVKFPRLDVVGIFSKLNDLLPVNSWVTALKITGGVVEIEGNSPDPTVLLETLVQEPDFAEVAFSRPTQGQNFGISFRLVGFDVPAYIQEYFPTEQ